MYHLRGVRNSERNVMLSPVLLNIVEIETKGRGPIVKAVSCSNMQKLKGTQCESGLSPWYKKIKIKISPWYTDEEEARKSLTFLRPDTELVNWSQIHLSLLLEDLLSHRRDGPRESQAGENGLQNFRSSLSLATVFTSILTEFFCFHGNESNCFLVSYNTTKLFNLGNQKVFLPL